MWRPANPFLKRPELIPIASDFSADLSSIVTSPFVSLTCQKGLRAREKLIDAFMQYHRDPGEETGSKLVKEHYRIGRRYSLPERVLADNDVGLVAALNENTAAAAYRCLVCICTDSVLLAEIREELDELVTRSNSKEDHTATETLYTFQTNLIRQKCPLFASALHESLRLSSVGTIVRAVLDDIMIGDQYLLKKGGLAFSASGQIHHDSAVWPDAPEFQPRRFMQWSAPERQIPGAFRTFGGGASICGGKQLTVLEIMSALGGLLTRYDIEPKDGSWIFPSRETCAANLAVPRPYGVVEVLVAPRKGFENAQWRFVVEEE